MEAMIIRVVTGVRKHWPERVAEWALSVILVNWGVVLASPANTFASSPSFSAMAAMAPEIAWAAVCLVAGALRIIALLINGTFAETAYSRYSPHVRAFMAIISCFVWLQISLGLLSSGIASTGIAVYPVLLALDIWCVFHAMADTGRADRRARHNGLG